MIETKKKKGRSSKGYLHLICLKCANTFTVPWYDRFRKYCSKECAYSDRSGKNNSNFRNRGVQKSKCGCCNKWFVILEGEDRKYCPDCRWSWMKGSSNPCYKEPVTKKCLYCGEDFSGVPWAIEFRLFCSQRCYHFFQQGEGHWNWQGGISKKPYSFEFNLTLKNYVKRRDGNRCILCSCTDDLCVHHIDYDKKNSHLNNLITLCKRCNSKVNFGRNFWFSFFKTFLRNVVEMRSLFLANVQEDVTQMRKYIDASSSVS